jgi:hypothetical protein
VLHCILNQRLHAGEREEDVVRPDSVQVPDDPDRVFGADSEHRDVILHERQFLVKGDEVSVTVGKHVALHIRKVIVENTRACRIVFDEVG